MAIHRNRAQVYSVYGTRVRSVGVGEAYEMIRTGTARLISSTRSAQVSIQLNVTLSADRVQNQSSITVSDIQAAAGILPGLPRPDRVRVRRHPDGSIERQDMPANFCFRAMAKVVAWPYVGDRQSVRVGPRGASKLRRMSAAAAEQCRFVLS